MDSNDFDKNYKQLMDKVYPHIKDQKIGTLNSVVYFILDEVQAEQLCQKYGIGNTSPLNEDLKILDNIIYTVYIARQKKVSENSIMKNSLESFKNYFEDFRQKIIDALNSNDNQYKIELIVFTSVILIGLYLSRKLLSKNSSILQLNPENNINQRRNTFIPTAICLAVPSSSIYDLTVGKVINRDQIIQIIDSASYFLCSEIEEAGKLSIDIDSSQEPSADSQLKFYIRIDIPDGKNILGVQTIPILKGYIRELPSNTQGKIKKLGRLGSVYSLKSFNRI
ncbi:hypothetical protein ACN4EE_00285 [Geminocystis sp. CENA526]|uniref:hypothetical protein n=1 Tax=Geminocystis sp. CENA526 TaxID=1355871 RepID=UPI003D6F00D6